MKIANRDEVLFLKEERRKKIKELEYHSHGDCIHVGKISRGCTPCFLRNNKNQFAIYTGCECNVKCEYCYYDSERNDTSWNILNRIKNNKAQLYSLTEDENCQLEFVGYNSWGETLMYVKTIAESSNLVKKAEQKTGRKIYTHLYTNGILADKKMLGFLKSCRIDEIRFHLSASNFSERVLANMEMAKEMEFIITVEEPSLQENKDKIMELLPYFEKIKLDHLDIVECQVTQENKQYLEKKYQNSIIYRDYLWHLYDEGMVYDIIEERIKNNFSFSVIDCNSRVEVCRGGSQFLIPELVSGDIYEALK